MSAYDKIILPVYIINLKKRTDRLAHIMAQFKEREEFETNLVEAVPHNIGGFGRWLSMRSCVQQGIDKNEDLIVICEDDHVFTNNYSRDAFLKNILEAYSQGCDVLCGGIGGFQHAVPVTQNRYWIDSFLCTQFIVLYKKFFKSFMNEPFDDTISADCKISEMTSHKMVLYPFISIQYDFGYSDTSEDNKRKRPYFFDMAAERLGIYSKIFTKYLIF